MASESTILQQNVAVQLLNSAFGYCRWLSTTEGRFTSSEDCCTATESGCIATEFGCTATEDGGSY